MKCYRVWYSNGSAILIDAENARSAMFQALDNVEVNGYPELSVSKVECLD
ncbi:hypothetical protein KAR91_48920 [Candidatus Pacearchaeota archaeon]|nr:hypothetical protein [Candidatus Pacearchaeota archaeon]